MDETKALLCYVLYYCVWLFVYFHQISFAMTDNKINGYSLANCVLALWESTVNSQSHKSLMSESDNIVLDLSELEICLILVGKLFNKNSN